MLGLFALAAACGPDSMPSPGAQVAAKQDAGSSGEHERGEARKVLTATLHGVPRPFTGATNAVRGVSGAGLPWALAEGKATLHADGTLEAEVVGLGFDPADPAVISRGTGGTNPLPQAEAIVSCLTVQDGAAVTVNVSSAAVPFTTGAVAAGGGNATIQERLALPTPCLAPIVFVTATNGTWLAATGF